MNESGRSYLELSIFGLLLLAATAAVRDQGIDREDQFCFIFHLDADHVVQADIEMSQGLVFLAWELTNHELLTRDFEESSLRVALAMEPEVVGATEHLAGAEIHTFSRPFAADPGPTPAPLWFFYFFHL